MSMSKSRCLLYCTTDFVLSLLLQVVQVYLTWPEGGNGPIRQLVGTARIHIQAGQSTEV